MGCTIQVLRRQAVKAREAVGQKRKRAGGPAAGGATETDLLHQMCAYTQVGGDVSAGLERAADETAGISRGRDVAELQEAADKEAVSWRLAHVIGCQALSAEDEQVSLGRSCSCPEPFLTDF